MLVTYVPPMRNSDLEIKIAGSSAWSPALTTMIFFGMVMVVRWMSPDIPPVDRTLDDRGDHATGFANSLATPLSTRHPSSGWRPRRDRGDPSSGFANNLGFGVVVLGGCTQAK